MIDTEEISEYSFEDAPNKVRTVPKAEKVICGGLRAKDMALRIKYAGVKEERIIICDNEAKAIDEAMASNQKTYVLPNYTALEPVRKIVSEKEKGGSK